MNESINLIRILKNCPTGTKFYSTIYGEVIFYAINEEEEYPIILHTTNNFWIDVTASGRHVIEYEDSGECTLFPSKDQRDWSKFTAPWYKKEKFDPKTLKPFDKIIACLDEQGIWCCELFSFIEENTNLIKCCGAYYKYCVPYNEDTKHLIGTKDEAPEYYRYWEDKRCCEGRTD